MDDITLPPLPYPQTPGNDYTGADMQSYARAAVLAERETLEALRSQSPCPYIRSSDEGTHWCALAAAPHAEPVAWQWLDTGHFRKSLPDGAERAAWRPLYAQSGPQSGYSRDLPVTPADGQDYGHLAGDKPAPDALREEVESLREANEKFDARQKWWNERMFTLETQNNSLREAARMALEALEDCSREHNITYVDEIVHLREALEGAP